jgi:transcriptional regulator GlxA family with amidase domain
MDPRIETTINLMKVNLNKHLTLPSLGQSVNLSPDRLSHVFKDEIGVPPSLYLRFLRMEQAKELLETTFLTVKQVMVRVGLKDESHFVRDFKRFWGSTPAQYRDRHNQLFAIDEHQYVQDS